MTEGYYWARIKSDSPFSVDRLTGWQIVWVCDLPVWSQERGRHLETTVSSRYDDPEGINPTLSDYEFGPYLGVEP